MNFDIPTLLVAAALTSAVAAGARVLLWRMHPEVAGLAQWMWAGIASPLALLLIAGHVALSMLPLLSLAQILIVGGLILAWDGFSRFTGRPRASTPILTTIGAITLGTIGLAHFEGSISVRSFTNAALIAALSGLIARDLLSAARAKRVAMRATGWAYGANAVFFLGRAILVARAVHGDGQWNPDGYAALPLLWWSGITVAITLGMVLMTGERLQASLDRQISVDPLTGVLNRRAFQLLSEKEKDWAQRHDRSLSLMMMDLDHFKQVNDHLGHGGGDDILRHFVAVSKLVLRGKDALCRIGGEEFVAVLPDTTAAQALAAAERLRAAFAEGSERAAPAASVLPFAITVSIGVSELGPDEDIDSALSRADAALYRAKAAGRNRCESAYPLACAPSQT
ncbi:MAG: hypothetical protein B7Z66_11055 [Chromatiales bacterium 21-64-14]|nr:MAG: hypothetical protein B7Z66_11055 [Chromatiales bacterium 21-64-14]HQU17268.1 GGDEF domain-containing protein [Gammaproteobacteria bacterium]